MAELDKRRAGGPAWVAATIFVQKLAEPAFRGLGDLGQGPILAPHPPQDPFFPANGSGATLLPRTEAGPGARWRGPRGDGSSWPASSFSVVLYLKKKIFITGDKVEKNHDLTSS